MVEPIEMVMIGRRLEWLGDVEERRGQTKNTRAVVDMKMTGKRVRVAFCIRGHPRERNESHLPLFLPFSPEPATDPQGISLPAPP